MSVPSKRLPPSSRDFEIYRLVQVLKLSQRSVATHMKLSPTRIRQIVQKVAEYIGEELLEVPEMPLDQKLKVAEYIASERVNHLFGVAMRSFDKSQKNKETVREVVAEGKPTTIIRTSTTSVGSVQFLNAALRYSLAASKLPPASLSVLDRTEDEIGLEVGEALAEEFVDVPVEEVTQPATQHGPTSGPCYQASEVVTTASSHPPVGDCATEEAIAVESSPLPPSETVVNRVEVWSYREQTAKPVVQKSGRTSPAQPGVLEDVSSDRTGNANERTPPRKQRERELAVA